MTDRVLNCPHCNRAFKWHSSMQIHQQRDCPKSPVVLARQAHQLAARRLREQDEKLAATLLDSVRS